MAKPALGRGLGALIPKSEQKAGTTGAAGEPGAGGAGTPVEIELTRITPNEYQPRKTFIDDSLHELADSIKQKGVIQPVVVRKRPSGGYELIAGERRFRASKLAGLKSVPAIIKDVSPADALELALIENIQREDLNPIETADAFDRLMREFGLTQEKTAERVGKERSTVANYLRLLTLPPDAKKDLASGAMSMGHAKALLALDDPKKQMELRREIVTRGLSVREAEALAKKLKAPGSLKRKVEKKSPSAQVRMLEDELKSALGTKVHILPKGKGGRIEIEYYSNDELERLLDIFRK